MVDKLNINYSGHQINAEPISVPENSPYKARTVHNRILKEEPSTIEIWQHSDKSGSWLTEEPYTGTVSSTGKFQVDYDGAEDGDMKFRNTIIFHAAQANTEWFIWYKSVGDIYDADDFNAKVNKTTGTENNFAALDNAGGIKDSGKKADDFEPKIDPKGTAFNKNFGNTTGTVCEGNDSRLSDARPPTAHKDSHITGGDDIIPNAVPGGNSGLMTGADKQNLDDAVTKKHEHSNKSQLDTYSATTANLTFYVNPSTGSDENDGSSGSPFKTIAKAVSMIPQIVNHTVTINLADGNYSEGIALAGYMGGGEIYILGNIGHPENVVIAGEIYAVGCSVGYIELYGMETTNTGSDGIYLADCSSYLVINHVLCDTTDDYDGVCAISCPTVKIKFSTFSNRWNGISAYNGTTVISTNNDGANNDVGLYADAATIMKYGTQPGGTTNESTSYGGQILSSRLAERDEDAVENNLAKFDSSGNPVDSGIASNTVPIATTQNLTFYVNPSTGNDNNNGSSGSPFKTIAKAVSMIPQIVNHNVTISLADGNYSEGITLTGYVGSGSINVVGNTTNPENVVFSGGVTITQNQARIQINGLKTTITGTLGIYVNSNSGQLYIKYFQCVTADANYAGIYIVFSPSVLIQNSTISNRKYGIFAANCSRVFSYLNSGTDNTIGLYVQDATIMKNSTQPGGTMGEATASGGVIR